MRTSDQTLEKVNRASFKAKDLCHDLYMYNTCKKNPKDCKIGPLKKNHTLNFLCVDKNAKHLNEYSAQWLLVNKEKNY